MTWSDTPATAGEAWKEKHKCFYYLFLYPACLYSNSFWDYASFYEGGRKREVRILTEHA